MNSVQKYLEVLRGLESGSLTDLVFFQARRLERLVRHARENVAFSTHVLTICLMTKTVWTFPGGMMYLS